MRKYSFVTLIAFSVLFMTCTTVYAAGGVIPGAGTEGNPYLIEDFNDFQAFCGDRSYWDEGVYIQLDCDLDLDPNLAGRVIYDIPPVANRAYYSGQFDGNGHTINNLTIDGAGYCGLFGRTAESCLIKNLGLQDCDITSTSDFGAPLVAYGNGDVNNCYASGIVDGAYQTAGLIGYNFGGCITNCYSTCNITGEHYIGGLIASSNGGDITNCYTTGNITGSGDCIGCLIGENKGGSITDCYTTGNIASTVGDFVACLVGYNSSCDIFNCYTTGSITSSMSYKGCSSIGGLVGENNNSDITKCYTKGNVQGYSHIGGLIGSNNNGNINRCFAKGNIKSYYFSSGLVGNNNGNINNCYATGILKGYNSVAGIAGCNDDNGSITNCYSTCRISNYDKSDYMGPIVGKKRGTTSNCFWDVYVTRIPDPQAGGPDKDGMIGLTTELMQTQNTFTDAGWDFVGETINGSEDIWQMPACHYPRFAWETISTEIGSPSNPYLIRDYNDFVQFCNDPNFRASGFYTRLETDIDLDPNVIYTQALIAPDTNDSNDEFDGIAYAGHFDGNGHIIRNLTCDGEDYLGLFGYVDGNAEIKDLGLENISIIGDDYIGGLIGYNNGITIDCYTTGYVKGNYKSGNLMGASNNGLVVNCYSTGDHDGRTQAGGLIGRCYYSIITDCHTDVNTYNGSGLIGTCKESDITNCYATGNVTATSYSAAGLVADNDGGVITNCYFSGDVNCPDYATGGLVGYNRSESDIIGCYSIGTVCGEQNAGGLVGNNYNGANIINCYSAASIKGGDYVGGLVGDNNGNITNCYAAGYVDNSGTEGGLIGHNDSNGITTNCFWDKEATTQTSSAGGTGLTTAQMKTQSIFTDAGWDFVGETDNGEDDIWQMPDGYRPRLAWETPPENPFMIADYNDFVEFCSDNRYWTVGITAILQADIDLDPNLPGRMIYNKAPISYFLGDVTPYDDYYIGLEYGGHFQGNGHLFKNFNIDGIAYCALFGKTDVTSVIENLGIQNAVVNSSATHSYSAPLVGYNLGDVINCYSENSDVSGYSTISALVGCNGTKWNGLNEANIINCYSIGGEIEGQYYTGGLAGENIHANITQSHAICQITASYSGGLVGFNNEASITDCYSSGNLISRSDRSGGLVGLNSYGPIDNCYSSQNVEGHDYIGGLIGENYGTTKNCHATGQVTGQDYVGGLIGKHSKHNIINCYSTGLVTGEEYIGGLAGHTNYSTNINNCYAIGDVNGIDGNYVGGLVGNASSQVYNCYAKGQVKGNDYVGGLAGKGCFWNNCYSTGRVIGSGSNVGALMGEDGAYSTNCFWDVNTTGIADPEAGVADTDGMVGKTTAEMQILSTFTDAGWDFLAEGGNGNEDIWRMCVDGVEYPRLSWEFAKVGDVACYDGVDIYDLQVLVDNWLSDDEDTSFYQLADINADGVINLQDYVILAENWLGGI